jgi:hypothetical protein
MFPQLRAGVFKAFQMIKKLEAGLLANARCLTIAY